MTFGYDPESPVLRDVSFAAPPGHTLALVGPTGAGKSTIVNLICRFYEPTGGRIRFGGRDYRELTLHAIQSRIGMVLQTPHLFSGTILENIRYGRLEATREEVIAAAKTAGAHTFIAALPDGYDTEVGEGAGEEATERRDFFGAPIATRTGSSTRARNSLIRSAMRSV